MANAAKLAGLAVLAVILLLQVSCAAARSHHGGGKCRATGFLEGKSHRCNRQQGSECCVSGRRYPQFRCSPPVSARTPATLTLNGFGPRESGGGPGACDGRFHRDSEMVVALSSGWLRLDGVHRCSRKVRVTGAHGRSVVARVVDECDSVNGCDAEHNFEPPCASNVVDASPAVWKALGLDTDLGEVHVRWSDASYIRAA